MRRSRYDAKYDPSLPTVRYDNQGTVICDEPTDWSNTLALKEEMQSLEYVASLEEKVTAASMQNKVAFCI